MKINIEYNKILHSYRADMTDLPGTPPVGEGSTPDAALGRLLRCLVRERAIWGKYWAPLNDLEIPQEIHERFTPSEFV